MKTNIQSCHERTTEKARKGLEEKHHRPPTSDPGLSQSSSRHFAHCKTDMVMGVNRKSRWRED